MLEQAVTGMLPWHCRTCATTLGAAPEEISLKPRRPRPRKPPARDALPPEVPEVVSEPHAATSAKPAESDEVPDAIRRMLEAAYT